MSETVITNMKNNRIKEVSALLQRQKARRQSGLFVVEGSRMTGETPPSLLKEIFVSETFSYKNDISAPVTVVSDQVFSKMSDTMHPQGILAVVRQPEYKMEDILSDKGNKRRFLVLENVQDPGNVGTMVRTAEAAGMTGVLMSRGCADIFNPKTVRSTMGSLYRMPFCYFDDMRSLFEEFTSRGIKTCAAALEGSVSYDAADYGNDIAILIGNEGNGLEKKTVASCDMAVRIPMDGQVESLNAAISASILMYEVRRRQKM